MSKISIGTDEKAALWRQRLFEAQAAMTQTLLQRHAKRDIAPWVEVSAQIYSDLPAPHSTNIEGWKRAFFRAQALIEKFIVEHYGAAELDIWAEATGDVARALEPDGYFIPAAAVDRLARHAELYGSTYEIANEDPDVGIFTNTHCAIWDYREHARASGTPITLKSACTFCTKLLSALVQAKGCHPRWTLFENDAGHGCEWAIRPFPASARLENGAASVELSAEVEIDIAIERERIAGTIVDQASALAGYEEASALLQRRDEDWVLGLAGFSPHSIADLGCGIGSLLEAATSLWPDLQSVTGLEKSALRLETARRRLGFLGDRLTLIEGDLLEAPALKRPAELMTMTAVLHWLYPQEADAFRWISENLTPGGVLLLTSHHPDHDDEGLGGEDDIVRQALANMGVCRTDTAAETFREAGIIPLGTRTRDMSALRRLLERYFAIDSVSERRAVLRVRDSAEYQRFHAATFGTYYSCLVGPERAAEFFAAAGSIAERRMRDEGYVTDITVRVWRCTKRRSEK